MEEIWKDIPGFPGYQVSNTGHIRSNLKSKRGTVTWRPFRPEVSKGYLVASMTVNGKRRRRFVHAAVLEAFVGPCPANQECRHLDGNKQNNRLENLTWGTRKENFNDLVSHGRNCLKRGGNILENQGVRNKSAKLTGEKIKSIRDEYQTGNVSQMALAKKYGVSQGAVWKIVSRQAWSHVG